MATPYETPDSPSSSEIIPAAQYIRMSTEHQQYSTANQADAIGEFAKRRGYVIVATYADEGKSGLQIKGRDALRRLLDDVQSRKMPFKAILVYDISRWGRFQDCDESAFYEYTCRRVGIHVEYCTEQFQNDGSPMSALFKTVKRTMAGEYSRELSHKVFKGQCRLIQLGYRQGGPAGFGLRRMRVDEKGNPQGILNRGEHKCLQTDRVILVPGPDGEVAVVRQMYDMFTRTGRTEADIADWLNTAHIANTEVGRSWSLAMVRQVLTNEKYVGNNVYNRVSFKLKKKRVRNTPDMWVRVEGAFEPLIDPNTFETARRIFLERARRFSDDELITKLRDLFTSHGSLSAAIIDGRDGMLSSCVYRHRFGSLLKAYALAGYRPNRDFRYLEINQHLRNLVGPFLDDVIGRLNSIGATTSHDDLTGALIINGEYSTAISMTRCRQTPTGSLRWLINFCSRSQADLNVIVRMDADNKNPVDFFLFPKMSIDVSKLTLREINGIDVDAYRFDTLGYFVNLAARSDVAG
jgi:DNA invertase Pin-like site-specific DNA recombinase